jgi:hypothetical protein
MASSLCHLENLKFPQDGFICSRESQREIFKMLTMAYRPYKISTISVQLFPSYDMSTYGRQFRRGQIWLS